MDYDYKDMYSGKLLSDYDLHERYDDMLDECCDEINIGTLTYQPSHVLKNVDPIAYRVGFSEWLDSELEETITEVER